MLGWLKYFCLGFFSDKLAKEGKNRNFLNFILGFALALVFLFCGLLAASALPFGSLYYKSGSFRKTVGNVFGNLGIEVEGGYLSCDRTVNTYTDAADRNLFGTEGYGVIVDTRPGDTFDDFNAYCISQDGRKIEYEDYLALGEEERADYEFKFEYTPYALDLDEALVKKCEDYLSAVTDEDVSAQFAELKGIEQENYQNYARGIYNLYIGCYYKGMDVSDSSGVAPLLRNYYYDNFVSDAKAENYLILLNDVLVGDFTAGGVRVSFYGLFTSFADGKIGSGSADGFILAAHRQALPVTAIVYLNNIFLYLPVLVLIPLSCAFALWLAGRIGKSRKPYIDCLKIISSFVWWSALLCAVAVGICGFFLSAQIVNSLPVPLFFGIMAVRTAVYLILERIRNKNSMQTPEIQQGSEN